MTAICDGGAATCARAAKLRITFTLEPNLPTLKGEILNGFRKMSGSFVMSAESAALANGNGVPGFVPIWDAGLTLIPSVIEEDFASGDMSIKPQGSPGVVEVYGNAQLGRVPFVPGTTLDVIKTGVFAREIQIGIPGSGIGDLKSRDLASHDPNFSAVFQAGNLTVNTPTGIDANLWTGKVAVSNNVSSLYFISAKSFMVPSDQRLKKDVQKIKNVETLISHLNPVSFKWLGFEDSDIGFIAQDVEAVFPQLVQISENGDKTVRYLSLVAPLGEAIKDFYSKQFQDLQESDRRIQDLENQISK